MKKIFLILMLISSDGWAANCVEIKIENLWNGSIFKCDMGEEICYIKKGIIYLTSQECFKIIIDY